MRNKILVLLTLLPACVLPAAAQVQVSKEPLHKKVLGNKYIRLMDVWLQPGDTTQFHIHSTPSVFLHFSNTTIASQVKGQDWVKEQTIPGKTWYRSFSTDTLVHRVCNVGAVPFHVTDIEILSSYDKTSKRKPLPLSLLDENEKTFAYSLTKNGYKTGTISNRGPMIAELVSGEAVYYVHVPTRQKTAVKTGGYLYIEPGASFYFNFMGKEKVNMVLFEIK